jgi:hypothetical protein
MVLTLSSGTNMLVLDKMSFFPFEKKISLFVGQVPRILKKDTGVWGFFKLVKKKKNVQYI